VRNRRITILDTTLRDGEQSPGIALSPDEKVEIAHALDELGVDVIEAGFAVSSPGDFEGVRAVAAAVSRPTVASLSRTRREDLDAAVEALAVARGRTRVHIVLATSPIHMEFKLGLEPEEVVDRARESVSYVHGRVDEVEFACEDATRSDPTFVADVCRAAIGAGATTINLPDTVGYSLPDEYAAFVSEVRRLCPELGEVTLAVHCHDDLGLAVANTLAALRAGARQVECTINGIGERAGNASLEEIVMATKVRADRLPYESGIHSEKIFATSQLLTALTGEPVQANKAIVGRNAFAHEAGIHQDGMLKDRRTYEIMRPEDVGVPSTTLVLGKHSGRHAVQHRVQQLGLELSRLELDRLYRRMVALADQQKTVSDAELVQIVADLRAPEPAPSAQGAGHRHGSGTEEIGYGHGV